MRVKTVVLIALIAIAVLGMRGDPAHAQAVIYVPKGDAEMAVAIEKARASLPVFWASYASPKPSESGHALKVSFPYGTNNQEHIWMTEVKKVEGGRYSGRFDDEPVHLPGKHEGDLVEFTEADISDWMFMRNGKIVGGETIRPLLKSIPEAEAAALRARMETP